MHKAGRENMGMVTHPWRLRWLAAGLALAALSAAAAPPATAPSLSWPEDGTFVYERLDPSFWCWTVSGATGCEIQFDGADVHAMMARDSRYYYFLGSATPGPHTWRCRATNADGAGPWSATLSFTFVCDPITFGTQYLGANADGTHNWSTTVYNGFREASACYAIYGIVFGTTLAQGYGVGSSVSDWYDTGRTATGEPLTDSFGFATGDSDGFIYPIGMAGYPNSMTTYYTTPAHVDRLGTTVNTFYTDAAGSYAVAGAMPVAAAPAVRVLGVAAGGVAGRRVALGVEGPLGRPSFRLQARASLGGGAWEELGRFSVTGAVTTVVATNAAPACFYRAVVP